MLGDLALTTAADVDAALRRMYGADLARATGVVHVAAVWQASPERHVVIAIGSDAPASAHDFLALQAARARADAIITTGQNLRAEPALTHDLQGAAAPGLAAWRRERLGKEQPPILLVLTSGRDLPVAHPALHATSTPLIFTSHEGARALPDTPIHVLSVAAPDIRAAIDHLRACGCRTILVEAGPSTASALYQPPVAVDELLLSVFHGALPARARARDFVAPEHIRAYLPHASAGLAPAQLIDEPSGPWQLLRFVRDPQASENQSHT
jgi:riboflavin biosynthesis pyrimidine reductase